MPSTSRRPSLLKATATITSTETMRPVARTFQPEIGPVAFQRPVKKGGEGHDRGGARRGILLIGADILPRMS